MGKWEVEEDDTLAVAPDEEEDEVSHEILKSTQGGWLSADALKYHG